MPESSRRPVRVAFVSDSMPERNGVGAYYTDLIEQLDRQRFEPVFLCPGNLPARARFPLPGDATQHIYLPPTRRFAQRMRAFRPNVVVVATPGPWGMLGQRWARKLGARLLVGFHTDYAGVTDLYRNPLLRLLSRRYFQRIDRMLFRHADEVLGNSQAMVEQALAQGAHAASRIGTLAPRLLLDTPPRPLAREFGTVLFAGRLAREKRVGAVLRAAEALPMLRFIIAGDGPLRTEVESAAARLNNLEAVGWQSRAGLLEQFDRADALVLPSEFESFGNVALEAMARGRIAIVTPTCGIVNWPDLARHLLTLSPDRTLPDLLSDLRDWPAERRQALADGGREAALALNRASLAQWQQLLKPAARPGDAVAPR